MLRPVSCLARSTRLYNVPRLGNGRVDLYVGEKLAHSRFTYPIRKTFDCQGRGLKYPLRQNVYQTRRKTKRNQPSRLALKLMYSTLLRSHADSVVSRNSIRYTCALRQEIVHFAALCVSLVESKARKTGILLRQEDPVARWLIALPKP